jgi:hypothetical protein
MNRVAESLIVRIHCVIMDKSLITTGRQAQSSDNTADAGKIRSQHEPNDDSNPAI